MLEALPTALQNPLYEEIAKNKDLLSLSSSHPIYGFFSGLIRHKCYALSKYYSTYWTTEPQIEVLIDALYENAGYSATYNHDPSHVTLPDYTAAIDRIKREFDSLYDDGATPTKGFKRYDPYFHLLSHLNTEMHHHTGKFFTKLILDFSHFSISGILNPTYI